MLVQLAIRDIVLIDRLDLSFEGGLSVLTGETGAGKSIVVAALGLAQPLFDRFDFNMSACLTMMNERQFFVDNGELLAPA